MTDIRAALDHAASSLETIWRIAGRGDHMMEFSEVRAYAAARAEVARAALAEQPAQPLTERAIYDMWNDTSWNEPMVVRVAQFARAVEQAVRGKV